MKRKSILLKFALAIFFFCAMAFNLPAQTTYTISDYADQAGEQYGIETHVLDNNVTLYTVECFFTTELRVYSNSSHDSYFYTNALPFYIESLDFNMGYRSDAVDIYGSADGDEWTLVGQINVNVSNNQYDNFSLSFGDDDYNFFKFDVNGSNQIRVKSFTINYKSTGPDGQMAQTPAFSPAPGFHAEPLTVTLSTSTEGATIYYTTDGTTPTEESTVYTEPFEISQTTTVKAIAVADGFANSTVATATYLIPVELDNIAAFKTQQTGNQPYVIANNVTFVYKNGSYTYVKDATASLLIYSNSFPTFEEGDQISNLTGTLTEYATQKEMVPSLNPAASETNIGAVDPITLAVSDLLGDYDNYDAQLVTVENVVFIDGYDPGSSNQTKIVQGSDTLILYNRFGVSDVFYDDMAYNVTGFVGRHHGKAQIYPRGNSDVVEYTPVVVPSLAITAPADGAEFSTLDTLPIGIQIENFNLDVDGYLKLETSLTDGLDMDLASPIYLDQAGFDMLLAMVMSPIPEGEHTVTLSLVDMEHNDLEPAVTATTTFTVTAPQLPAPVFTPVTGTYADSVTFSISSTVEGAEIHYTTDGSEPTSGSAVFGEPLTLHETATVKAVATKDNWAASETATAVYTIVFDPVLTVSAESLSFNSENLTNTFIVSGAHLTSPIELSCTDPHFTLSTTNIAEPNSNTEVTVTFDGTEPATGVINIVSGEATSSAGTDESQVMTVQIALTATAKLAAPVMTPASTTSTENIAVEITVANEGASIHYTIDGTEPTAESAVYNTPIELNDVGTYTVKAFAAKENWENSDITTATYTIAPEVLNDTVIYATGFEASEGFEASTTYNNTAVKFSGNDGEQWGTYFGTPATNNKISGGQSMQMRWYASSPTAMGYTYTNFDLHNVTHVTFKAVNSNGLNVNVSHSVDGGNTYSEGQTFTVTSQAQDFDYVVDESGSYDFVRLKFSIVMPETTPNATSRLVIDEVKVYGFEGVAPSTVIAPVITPNSAFYYEPQTVTITCGEENAVIRYTTDGTEPTENSTVYSEPFTVSATTVIKAKAWKEGLTPSFVSSQTISFPVPAANIAAFKANSSTDVQRIMSDVTFVFRSGRYIFVEDNSAALLIYDMSDDNPVIITQYNEGDVIHAGIYGIYKPYQGMIELDPTYNSPAASGTATVAPQVASAGDIKAQYASVYESKLIRLNNVTFIDSVNFVQNGDTMAIFNRFNSLTTHVEAGDVADVIGFVSFHNDRGYQIFPRSNDDVIISEQPMEKVANPEFSFQLSGEFYFMTLTCATEGADIYYTIDGTDPDADDYHYTSAVPFQPIPLTIKAIAMKEGMENSDVVTYNFVGLDNWTNSISVYPNPASDYITVEGGMISRVEVYNTVGQLVRVETVNDNTARINVRDLVNGTYFIRAYSDGNMFTGKFVRR